MHVTLLLPGTLVPREMTGALEESLRGGALSTLLARAELVGDAEYPEPAHLGWLAEHVFHQAAPAPTAPYAYAALAGQAPPSDETLWHADPIHLELARDHLVLMPLPAPPSKDETVALLSAANALAAAAGATLVSVEGHWFLRARERWDVQPAPLSAALGEPLFGVMPTGDDAPMWHRLLNEIQMTWHQHAINEAREAQGERTINSLWLHGGGAWAPLPRTNYTAILADAPELRGAATAAGIPAGGARERPADGALIVYNDAFAPHHMRDWGGWLAAIAAINSCIAGIASTAEFDIVLTGERITRHFRTRSADRLKFWRQRRTEDILSE